MTVNEPRPYGRYPSPEYVNNGARRVPRERCHELAAQVRKVSDQLEATLTKLSEKGTQTAKAVSVIRDTLDDLNAELLFRHQGKDCVHVWLDCDFDVIESIEVALPEWTVPVPKGITQTAIS